MVPLLHHAAITKDKDDIGVLHGSQSVRHHHDGASLGCALECPLHQLFGLGVQAGRGLVEEEDPRVAYQRPRNADPLLLAAAEGEAALADVRSISYNQVFDQSAGKILNGEREHW